MFLPIEGNSPFIDQFVTANGSEVAFTEPVAVPVGFTGWVEAHITVRMSTNDTQTGIWMDRRKMSIARPVGNETLPINVMAGNASIPGYFAYSDNCANLSLKLVRSSDDGAPGDGTGVCLRVSGGEDGSVLNVEVRLFLSGTKPN